MSLVAEAGEANTLTVDLTARPPLAHDTTAAYQPNPSSCPDATAPECLADAAGLSISTDDGDDTIALVGQSR